MRNVFEKGKNFVKMIANRLWREWQLELEGWLQHDFVTGSEKIAAWMHKNNITPVEPKSASDAKVNVAEHLNIVEKLTYTLLLPVIDKNNAQAASAVTLLGYLGHYFLAPELCLELALQQQDEQLVYYYLMRRASVTKVSWQLSLNWGNWTSHLLLLRYAHFDYITTCWQITKDLPFLEQLIDFYQRSHSIVNLNWLLRLIGVNLSLEEIKLLELPKIHLTHVAKGIAMTKDIKKLEQALEQWKISRTPYLVGLADWRTFSDLYLANYSFTDSGAVSTTVDKPADTTGVFRPAKRENNSALESTLQLYAGCYDRLQSQMVQIISQLQLLPRNTMVIVTKLRDIIILPAGTVTGQASDDSIFTGTVKQFFIEEKTRFAQQLAEQIPNAAQNYALSQADQFEREPKAKLLSHGYHPLSWYIEYQLLGTLTKPECVKHGIEYIGTDDSFETRLITALTESNFDQLLELLQEHYVDCSYAISKATSPLILTYLFERVLHGVPEAKRIETAKTIYQGLDLAQSDSYYPELLTIVRKYTGI